MNSKIKEWWMARKPSKRRLIQLYAALLFNANLKGFKTGSIYKGPVKNICTPGLNCYSCPGASGACPLGALQNALSSSNNTVPFYLFGIIMLYGLLFGRWICGFLCPFGLIQDLLHKIKTPKVGKGRVTRVLSYFKYVILAFFVVLIPLLYVGFPMPGFCKYICPAGTLEGAVGLLSNPANQGLLGSLGALFTWKFVLMVIILVASIFIYRFFCRFICPLGAIYGLFNRFALVGVKLDRKSCTECGLCVGKCKMDIRHVGDHECINCGECIDVCPTGAISWKGPKILLPPQAIGGAIPTRAAVVTANAAPAGESLTLGESVPADAADTVILTASPDLPADETTATTDTVGVVETATADAAESVETATADAAESTKTAVTANETDAETAGDTETADDAEAATETIETPEIAEPAAETPVAEVASDTIPEAEEVPEEDMALLQARAQKRYFIVRIVTASVMALLLLGALFYYNFVDESGSSAVPPAVESTDGTNPDGETTEDAPVPGNQVGNLCYGMDLELYNAEGTFNVEENRGKVTVINFWGTWCGPCIAELPHFDAVARDYADRVTVVAVHSGFIPQGDQHPTAWIPANHPDTPMLFAQDPGDGIDGTYYPLLGGAGVYPTTIIVDGNGVITCVHLNSISHAELVAEVERALGE